MEANYFTILYWFCHMSTWICHGCTHVPHPESPSHLRPHTIPLGHPSAPAPSILYHTSNLDWRFISHMILYMFQCHSPKSSHPLPPASPSHPSRLSQCTGFQYLFHGLNLNWPSISCMVIYKFQCYSLKSSHPCLLPQSPTGCSIHLRLFCCLGYRVIITIFLNSICMHLYTVLLFFFLTYFTLYYRLQFHPPH